jgi:hypothetical protein
MAPHELERERHPELEEALAQVEDNVRMKQELEIGARIQTCLMPA